MPRIVIGGLNMEIERKAVKRLRLAVSARQGIRVSVPWQMSDSMAREFIASRIPWIRKHLEVLSARIPTANKYVSGEDLPFLGKYYPLLVRECSGRPSMHLRTEGVIEMRVEPGSTREGREALVKAWYRSELRKILPSLAAKWENIVWVSVGEWRLRDMRTKWGTCNIRAKRVWLSLELAKKPMRAIEYVIAHELTHLHERCHNARFRMFMDEFYPDWRAVKRELDTQTR